MNAERRFEVGDQGGTPDRGGQDATPPTRRRTGLRHPGGGKPRAKKATRLPKKEKKQKTGAGGLSFLVAPGFLLVLGALFSGALWLGALNRSWGTVAQLWPWDLFRAHGAEGGAVVFPWDEVRVLALAGALFVLLFLVAAPSRPGRGRGLLALLGVTFGVTMFSPDRMDMPRYVGLVVFALAAGALLAREGVRKGRGGRALLVVAIVLLAAHLFLPLPVPDTRYAAPLPNLVEALIEGPPPPAAQPGAPGETMTRWDILQRGESVVLLASGVLLVVLVVSGLGGGGRWALWTGGILLHVVAIGTFLLLYRESRADLPSQEAALREVSIRLRLTFYAFLLPLVAAVMDLSRPKPG